MGLDSSVVDEPSDRLAKHHKVLKAFVKRRSQNPEANETTQLPASAQVVFNLHAGRYRALTWYDQTSQTVWLLGVGWHERGSRDDAYAYLKELDRADVLFPTEADYQLLYASLERESVTNFSDIVRDAVEFGPVTRSQAEENLDTRYKVSLAGVLDVSLIVGDEEHNGLLIRRYEVRFFMPPLRAGVLPPDTSWTLKLSPAFMPEDADVSHFVVGYDETLSAWLVVYEEPLDLVEA